MLSAGEVRNIFALQKAFFRNGFTRETSARHTALERLLAAINESEAELLQALHDDLSKPAFEAYAAEIAATKTEIKILLKNLRRWSKPRRASVSWLNFPATGKIIPDPYGVVLVMGAWNYPFQLVMMPLAGAIAAGNCVIAKPSELAPATAEIITRIIERSFAPQHAIAVSGDKEMARKLLSEKFDYIFFTGGEETGRIVMRAAAGNLTPVTLELGGKSPCIVEDDADIELTAKRIAWGKFLNAGQTCVAPDYILVHSSVSTTLAEALKRQIKQFYGDNPESSPDYARIINDQHFTRILTLINRRYVYSGGRVNPVTRYIEPTILLNPPPNDPVMQDEIFGPLLPIIKYENIDEVIEFISNRSTPLALYYFSRKQKHRDLLLELAAGSICINDTILQVTNPSMPFGGVGNSGMGAYHGKFSFDTFTRLKPVMTRPLWIDIPLRYPPFSLKKLNFLRRFLK